MAQGCRKRVLDPGARRSGCAFTQGIQHLSGSQALIWNEVSGPEDPEASVQLLSLATSTEPRPRPPSRRRHVPRHAMGRRAGFCPKAEVQFRP